MTRHARVTPTSAPPPPPHKAKFSSVPLFASPVVCLHVGGRSSCQRDGSRLEVPEEPPPLQAAGAQYFTMDIGEDDGPAPAARRPAPLMEVRPQLGYERHYGSGFDLVLDVTVPQLIRELVDVPTVPFFVEQTVDISAPGGGGRLADLQGSSHDRVHQLVSVEVFKVHAQERVRQRRLSTSHPRQFSNRQWWSFSHPLQAPAPVVEFFSPATVFQLPAPVVEQPHGQALPGQRSTAFLGAEHHDHQRSVSRQSSTARRGADLHDSVPGQSSTA